MYNCRPMFFLRWRRGGVYSETNVVGLFVKIFEIILERCHKDQFIHSKWIVMYTMARILGNTLFKSHHDNLKQQQNHLWQTSQIASASCTCIDPLHIRGNAANLDNRTIRFFLHENRSQFPEGKISFVLSSRLTAFPWCARGLFIRKSWSEVHMIKIIWVNCGSESDLRSCEVT